MKLEQDPDELREIELALSCAARPTHSELSVEDQQLGDTIEFDSRAVIEGLGEFGIPFSLRDIKSLPDNTWKQRLKDPDNPELGFRLSEDTELI